MRYFRSIQSTPSSSSDIINHFDELTVWCLRALLCSETEWRRITPLRNLDELANSLSESTEEAVERLLKAIVNAELSSKATSLTQDISLLSDMSGDADSSTNNKGFGTNSEKYDKNKSSVGIEGENSIKDIVMFRIQKKKMLSQIFQ